MMLRIGEFACRGRVSVKAVRHDETVGLLRPARIDAATGYRSYELAQLDTLNRLMVFRALGLPLERIRPLLGSSCATCRPHSSSACDASCGSMTSSIRCSTKSRERCR
jgi:DNA-binding transcriptional MerR regulator